MAENIFQNWYHSGTTVNMSAQDNRNPLEVMKTTAQLLEEACNLKRRIQEQEKHRLQLLHELQEVLIQNRLLIDMILQDIAKELGKIVLSENEPM